MSEIPVQGRQSQIQPSNPVTGFSSAVQPGVQTHLSLGQIGQNIAQGASNERARQAGIEAANTPGSKISPIAFTQTDSEFIKSYRQEQGQLLQFQGNKLLRGLYEELNAQQRLSPESIDLFQQNASQGIEDLLQQSDSNNQGELKRNLSSAYESYYYNLSNKLNNQKQKELKEQRAAQLEQGIERIDDSWRNGKAEDALLEKNQIVKNLHFQAEDEGWSQEKLDSRIKAVNEKYVQGKYNAEYINTPEKDKPKFLEEMRDKLPSDLSPSQQDRVIDGTLQFANQYQAAYKTQQQINYTNFDTMIENGQPLPVDVDEQVSAQQFANLQHKQAAVNRKLNQTAELVSKMTPIMGDAAEMSQYTPEEVSEAHKFRVKQIENQSGEPLSIKDESRLAEQMKAPNKILTTKYDAMIRGGTPQQKIDASEALNVMLKNNPIAVKGISSEVQNFATSFKNSRESGVDPLLSLENAQMNTLNVPEDERISRANKFDSMTRGSSAKSKDFSNPAKLRKFAADSLGFDVDLLPSGVDEKFKRQLKENYIGLNDFDLAVNQTANQIKQRYSKEVIFGKERVMKDGFSLYNNTGVNATPLVENEAINTYNDIANRSKEKYDRGEIDWYYESSSKEQKEKFPKGVNKERVLAIRQALSNALTGEQNRKEFEKAQEEQKRILYETFTGQPYIEEVSYKELESAFSGDKVIVKQHFRDGSAQEFDLDIKSDERTAQPIEGSMPSYFLVLEQKGKGVKGIQDPDNFMPGHTVRFQPNIQPLRESVQKHVTETENKIIEKALNKEPLKKKAQEAEKFLHLMGEIYD